ncbi:cation:proton antiporter [Cytophagales bacterium LB-30]|uniref:Cation:proton antiporter n=1 Tax=Shiella aurantiaca TaxID=3058365 RepID=A0ABT8F0D9_9BACT|nr:cation:proton antiporter [Shiella aurantiaca]MDN4163905.1 cation:proton antiporter [Shiella aurantiaca]
MQIPLLPDIVIILGLSVLVILAFQRLKMPPILGFLLTGVIAGPHGLSLVNASHEVELLSEIGVILLLFIIGLEFSLKSLAAIKNAVFIGGSVQVIGTIALTALISSFTGFSWPEAIFMGFLFSLSSTAIVLKILQEKNAINSPQGKISLAILIFQDIIVVPMMLLTPIIAGKSDNVGLTLLILLGKAVLVIVFVIISARYVVPRLLYEVAKTKSRELFILTIVVTCFSVAWLSSSMGLSLALGAFMAGLIISESEYSHQATSNILPFREIFTSFFFVSIGMLLDVKFLFMHFPVIIGFTLLAITLKGIIAALATIALKYPPRVAFLVGFSLFQVGEFAFILSKTGIEYGILTPEINQYFLAISILTMGVTPFILGHAETLTDKLIKTPLTKGLTRFHHWQDNETEQMNVDNLKDHLIIIGFGINGQNVAKAAKKASIPYVIVELNATTVREQKANGEPIVYGDASSDVILSYLKVWSARVAVIAISDPVATKNIVSEIRKICRTVYVIVRTRFVNEIEENLQLGADEVIPEEFETSVEIFSRVLNKYLVPEEEINDFVYQIRKANYDMLRPNSNGFLKARTNAVSLNIPNIRITCVTVRQSDNEVVGKTLAESHLRKKYSVNLLAIERSGEFITDINQHTTIEHDDKIYLMGRPDNISALNGLLKV